MAQSQELRRRAERALSHESQAGRPVSSDVRELIRELQVHQVELELQNEELRESQLSLENSRQRYFELYDLAPVGYLTLTADARVVEANRSAAALLGVDRAVLIGQRFSRYIEPASTETFARHCRAVLSSGEHESCQLELRVPGRGRCEVRIESVRAGADSGHDFRAALIDVTELIRLERALREAQKLEAVGALASGVAHEFNNRLMAIVGCVEKAGKLVSADGEVGGLLDQVKEAALRGRAITTQLLTFARKGEIAEAELDEAVTASEPLLRQILGDTLRLQIRLDAAGARVRLSDGLIEQLLLTLAANARDAAAANGTFRIETKHVTESADSSHVLLVCSDDGNGMDPATHARAFEPFFTTKPPGAGVGLGLALVHGIVERAGGSIELASKLGEGTTLRFSLPSGTDRTTVADARADEADGREVALVGVRILVVEDEPLIRSNVAYHLRSLGCTVFEADGYEAALSQLRECSPSIQLVVTDIVIDGTAVATRIESAARQFAPDVRMVFISAHPVYVLMRRGWLEPGSRVLEKPFTGDQLKKAVLRTLA